MLPAVGDDNKTLDHVNLPALSFSEKTAEP